MQVVVKKPHIKIDGDVPEKLIKYLQKNYKEVEVINDPDEEYIDITETEFYKNIEFSPAKALIVYRKNNELTQIELGEKLGIPKQHVSNMERGTRNISLNMAKKLAKLFNVSIERFL